MIADHSDAAVDAFGRRDFEERIRRGFPLGSCGLGPKDALRLLRLSFCPFKGISGVTFLKTGIVIYFDRREGPSGKAHTPLHEPQR
jgi:hypothetical protein